MGFKKALGEWVFDVDSDDWLKDDCIENIGSNIDQLTTEYHSLSILRQYENGDIIGDKFINDLNTHLDRVQNNINGDKADVFRTSVISTFSFPVFNNVTGDVKMTP